MKVIAFDVNETLLDLSALDDAFEQVLGSATLRGQWFAQMLQLSFVGGLTGNYVDFTTAQHAALRMLAERSGTSVSEHAAADLVGQMTTLPVHPEVPDALRRLQDSPLTVVALTNSVQQVADAQLTNAGIHDLFAHVLSADTVQALKPAPAPYQLVASTCDVDIADVMLVAAHAWDVTGALAAGCSAAFVARPGMVLSPLGPRPEIVGADLAEVVERILARA